MARELRGYSDEQVEDTLQDVLATAWRKLPEHDGRDFRAWLFVIAANCCRNLRRKRRDLLPGDDAPLFEIGSRAESAYFHPTLPWVLTGAGGACGTTARGPGSVRTGRSRTAGSAGSCGNPPGPGSPTRGGTRFVTVITPFASEPPTPLGGPPALGPAEVSPDGRYVAAGAGANGRDVAVWDATIGRVVVMVPDAHANVVSDVRWSADGRAVTTVGWDGAATSWSIPDGRARRTWRGPVASTPLRIAVASPDGRVLVGGDDRVARILDDAGAVSRELRQPDPIFAAAWSADGERVATGTTTGEVALWDAAGGLLWSVRIGARVDELQFSSDGTLLFAWSVDRVAAWEVGSAQERSVPPSTAGLDVARDRPFAVTAQGQQPHVWRLPDWTPEPALPAAPEPIRDVAISSGGDRVLADLSYGSLVWTRGGGPARMLWRSVKAFDRVGARLLTVDAAGRGWLEPTSDDEPAGRGLALGRLNNLRVCAASHAVVPVVDPAAEDVWAPAAACAGRWDQTADSRWSCTSCVSAAVSQSSGSSTVTSWP